MIFTASGKKLILNIVSSYKQEGFSIMGRKIFFSFLMKSCRLFLLSVLLFMFIKSESFSVCNVDFLSPHLKLSIQEKKARIAQLQEVCQQLDIKIEKNGTLLAPNMAKLTLRGIGAKKLKQIWPAVRRITWLRILDLRENNLTLLPEGFEAFCCLEQLYLSHNHLSNSETLTSLSHLYALRLLHLDHNSLNTWPEAINDLPALENLALDHNQLTTIPSSIWKLSYLKFLYLDDNQIAILPPEIGKLTYLKVLGISENKLQEVPKEIQNLRQLQRLYLHENNITTLPSEIGFLIYLKELHLHHNPLRSVPISIRNLTLLEDLNLTHCPQLIDHGRNEKEWGKKELKAHFSVWVALS